MIISENLRNELNKQISREKYNANLYLFIAGYLKNKGLDNLAKIFEEQHQEETGHSKQIYDYLTDVSADVELLEIPKVDLKIDNIKDIAEKYLAAEIETTTYLTDIKILAENELDHLTADFLREMIRQQRDEYREATGFLDNALLTENDWKFVKIWNDSLEVGD